MRVVLGARFHLLRAGVSDRPMTVYFSYFLLHIVLGCVAGGVSAYLHKQQQHGGRSFFGIVVYAILMAVVLVMCKAIWWMGKNYEIAGLVSLGATLSVFPSVYVGFIFGRAHLS